MHPCVARTWWVGWCRNLAGFAEIWLAEVGESAGNGRFESKTTDGRHKSGFTPVWLSLRKVLVFPCGVASCADPTQTKPGLLAERSAFLLLKAMSTARIAPGPLRRHRCFCRCPASFASLVLGISLSFCVSPSHPCELVLTPCINSRWHLHDICRSCRCRCHRRRVAAALHSRVRDPCCVVLPDPVGIIHRSISCSSNGSS